MLVTSPERGVTYYSVACFDSEEMICLEYANLRLRKFNRKENRNALAWTASAILLKRCKLAYSELEYMIFHTSLKNATPPEARHPSFAAPPSGCIVHMTNKPLPSAPTTNII